MAWSSCEEIFPNIFGLSDSESDFEGFEVGEK
jgi:hypothetical protein